jgi:hypothetical protein
LNREGAPAEADAPGRRCLQSDYMLGFVHFFVASSHVILAFSQAALVVGIFAAARAGAVKATASPIETIAAMTLFMTPLSSFDTTG